ncbi:MAG: caspase family protein [Methylococcales bacterium]
MKIKILFQSIITILLLGCVSDPAEQGKFAADIARIEKMGDADKLFVVDCLLPGQIRRLGSKMTYLTARRAVKTSALECEVRGGEYVAYDRANYASALQTWLPLAEGGDAEAQTYVGEIYAKGQGLPPDYKAAAEWYRKAAAQGNSRAQINLGYLYEKGLGVGKDLGVAMEWYQKASGLEKEHIAYAATINSSDNNELVEEIKLLKSSLKNSRDESKALSEQLSSNQQQLKQSLEKLQNYQNERNQTQSKLVLAQSQGNAQEGSRLEKVLREKDSELASQQQQVATLEAQYQQKVTNLNHQLEETEKRAKQISEQLKLQQTASNDAQLKLLNAEARLANTEKQLLAANQSASEASSKTLKDSEQQQSLVEAQQKLAASEAERKKSQMVISQLETEKQKYEQQIQTLQKSSVAVDTISKPVIEIIDPPFVLVRGTPTVTMRSLVKERDIIGKVNAPAGVMSVMVNDIKNTLDDKGIFKSTVGIKGEKTPVNVVAIDRNGARASLEFLLALEGGAMGSQRSHDDVAPTTIENPWKNIDLGNYYALVIGNNHYEKIPQLDTPANDAREVDKVLSGKYGFKTKLLVDANRYQILSAMNELRGKLTENDNLLIYYAGHGELDQVNMRGHWLPIDADADNNANWISTVSITDILNSMSSKHIMIVADSCYSGAMTRASLARLDAGMSQDKKSEWLKAMLKAKSRTVLTSGGLKPVMDGGGGDHSVFANAFIKALQSNNGLLEGQELYRGVSANVIAIAANYEVEQVPQYAPVAHAGHEAGEFFFMPK